MLAVEEGGIDHRAEKQKEKEGGERRGVKGKRVKTRKCKYVGHGESHTLQ